MMFVLLQFNLFYSMKLNILRSLSCISSIRGVVVNMNQPTNTNANINAVIDVDMETVTYNNVSEFVPEIRMGKVVKVYDGDTITIAARMIIDGKEIPRLYRFNVRLNGIDTPELKTKNETEKNRAVLAKNDLVDLILGNIVVLKNVSYDKYGRILADVFTQNGINVSEWMITKGHAVRYNGGTKVKPDDWTM